MPLTQSRTSLTKEVQPGEKLPFKLVIAGNGLKSGSKTQAREYRKTCGHGYSIRSSPPRKSAKGPDSDWPSRGLWSLIDTGERFISKRKMGKEQLSLSAFH